MICLECSRGIADGEQIVLELEGFEAKQQDIKGMIELDCIRFRGRIWHKHCKRPEEDLQNAK